MVRHVSRKLHRYDRKTVEWLREAKKRQRKRDEEARLGSFRPTDEDLCDHDWMYRGLLSRECQKCGRVET